MLPIAAAFSVSVYCSFTMFDNPPVKHSDLIKFHLGSPRKGGVQERSNDVLLIFPAHAPDVHWGQQTAKTLRRWTSPYTTNISQFTIRPRSYVSLLIVACVLEELTANSSYTVSVAKFSMIRYEEDQVYVVFVLDSSRNTDERPTSRDHKGISKTLPAVGYKIVSLLC